MGVLAKVVPRFRGDYNAEETYYDLDLVRYNKIVWICTAKNDSDEIEGIKGETPSDTSTHWKLFAIDGIDGGGATISDNETVSNKTWSSSKIQAQIDAKGFTIDSELSSDSENPVQNKVVKAKFDGIDNKVQNLDDDGQIAYSNVTGKPSVIDDLTSESSTDVLSAKQGKELKALVDAKASTDTATTTADGLMSKEDKIALDKLKVLLGTTLATAPATLTGTTLDLNSISVEE